MNSEAFSWIVLAWGLSRSFSQDIGWDSSHLKADLRPDDLLPRCYTKRLPNRHWLLTGGSVSCHRSFFIGLLECPGNPQDELSMKTRQKSQCLLQPSLKSSIYFTIVEISCWLCKSSLFSVWMDDARVWILGKNHYGWFWRVNTIDGIISRAITVKMC